MCGSPNPDSNSLPDDSPKPADPTSEPALGPERPPRYEQVFRWVEYINNNPPEVWGPQQNAVVNGQIESARAVDVTAEDRERIRSFADAELRREDEGDESGSE